MFEKFDINMNIVFLGYWRRCRYLGVIFVNVMLYLNGLWIGKLFFFVFWILNVERYFNILLKELILKKDKKFKYWCFYSWVYCLIYYCLII